MNAALEQVGAAHGPARTDVNCAGVRGGMRLVDRNGPVDMRRVAQAIGVNLLGTVSVMTRCAARMMAEEPLDADGERGVVVNTASIAPFEGQVAQGAYVASKGGIVSLALQAAPEFAPRGVRVMAIAPGLFDTAIAGHVPREVKERILAEPMFPRRLGVPEEVGALALAICHNRMLDGETIRLYAGVRPRGR